MVLKFKTSSNKSIFLTSKTIDCNSIKLASEIEPNGHTVHTANFTAKILLKGSFFLCFGESRIRLYLKSWEQSLLDNISCGITASTWNWREVGSGWSQSHLTFPSTSRKLTRMSLRSARFVRSTWFVRSNHYFFNFFFKVFKMCQLTGLWKFFN